MTRFQEIIRSRNETRHVTKIIGLSRARGLLPFRSRHVRRPLRPPSPRAIYDTMRRSSQRNKVGVQRQRALRALHAAHAPDPPTQILHTATLGSPKY